MMFAKKRLKKFSISFTMEKHMVHNPEVISSKNGKTIKNRTRGKQKLKILNSEVEIKQHSSRESLTYKLVTSALRNIKFKFLHRQGNNVSRRMRCNALIQSHFDHTYAYCILQLTKTTRKLGTIHLCLGDHTFMTSTQNRRGGGSLTHFFPMFPFDPLDIFRGIKREYWEKTV